MPCLCEHLAYSFYFITSGNLYEKFETNQRYLILTYILMTWLGRETGSALPTVACPVHRGSMSVEAGQAAVMSLIRNASDALPTKTSSMRQLNRNPVLNPIKQGFKVGLYFSRSMACNEPTKACKRTWFA